MAIVLPVREDLWQVPLDPGIDGFAGFINAWVYRRRQKTWLIDPGPACTAEALITALDGMGIGHLDAILLTHIHLDHAGGAGHLAARFPEAGIVCHKNAIRHLADPNALWQGSLKVLGAVAMSYGPLIPIAAARLKDAALWREVGARSILTPGHAPHHVCYLFDDLLLAGEVAGVCLDVDDRSYMRPGTPPRFELPLAIESLETLLAQDLPPMVVGHVGLKSDSRSILAAHRDQLHFWESFIRQHRRQATGQILSGLLSLDPHLAAFKALSAPEQARETYFMRNSIDGFCGYIDHAG